MKFHYYVTYRGKKTHTPHVFIEKKCLYNSIQLIIMEPSCHSTEAFKPFKGRKLKDALFVFVVENKTSPVSII